jgi:hypothetical protein
LFGSTVGFVGVTGPGLKLFGPGRVALLVGDTDGLPVVGAGPSVVPHAVNRTTPTAVTATRPTARIRLRPLIPDPSDIYAPHSRCRVKNYSVTELRNALCALHVSARRGGATGLSVG